MKNDRRYILDEVGRPVAEPHLFKWVEWLHKTNRTVALDKIGWSQVSTVFLALDCSFGSRCGPILWETRVFGGRLKNLIVRCTGNWEQAEAMHAEVCAKVRAAAKRTVKAR